MLKSFCAGIISISMLLGLAMPTVTFAAQNQLVNPLISSMKIDKTNVTADGIDQAQIEVTLRDQNYYEITGEKLTLVSSRGSMDTIAIDFDTTNSLGKARFRVSSLRNGTSTYTVIMRGSTLPFSVTVAYANGLSFNVHAGDLIKIPDDNDARTLNDTAVYYYATDGRRYVFPNEKVYFTWYPDFTAVKTIPIDQMSLIPIGGNVTYHPASRLVKFQTDTKTYVVTRGGVLRWAATEDVVRGWYGPNWNQNVDDISEAFYVNYKFGDAVYSQFDLALDIVHNGTKTIDQDKGLTP